MHLQVIDSLLVIFADKADEVIVLHVEFAIHSTMFVCIMFTVYVVDNHFLTLAKSDVLVEL